MHIHPLPHLTSGTRAAMNSSCSDDSFFTICMRHFKRGYGQGNNSQESLCASPHPATLSSGSSPSVLPWHSW